MNAVLAAWLVEVGLITWRDLTGKTPGHTVNGLPLPADYMATFILFGALGLIPAGNVGASRFGAALAWAYVLATYMNIVNPTNPLQKGTPPSSSTGAPAAAAQGGTK